MMQILTIAGLAMLSTVSVLAALLIMRWIDGRGRTARLLSDGGVEPCIFLFRDDQLIDATEPAQALLQSCNPDQGWTGLMAWMNQRFENIETLIAEARQSGRTDLQGKSGSEYARLRLRVELIERDTLRLTLTDPTNEAAGILVDPVSQDALEAEVTLLRRLIEDAPMMIWRSEDDGSVTWANAAYLRQVELHNPDETPWPLPRLLAPQWNDATADGSARAKLGEGSDAHWFDCHATTDGNAEMVYALPADAEVRAENNLREFLQTLTKTFADLPIGLAIFDRDRNLQLFNPALVDLTGLSAGFLTSRPSLVTVLDRLRELRMIPEPKDYRSWRQQTATLEQAAATGHHVETWTLPGGQTYRVTGRPHPGGAVAFLFEDITSEIALTRKFRADLSLGNQVLDAIDDGLALFGPDGRMILCNTAYQNLWENRHSSLNEAFGTWRKRLGETPGLAMLQDAVLAPGDVPKRGVLTNGDGGLIGWRVNRLTGGKTMLRFDPHMLGIGRSTEDENLSSAKNDPVGAEKHSKAKADEIRQNDRKSDGKRAAG